MYAPKMKGLCFRYIGESEIVKDIVQDGFIKVFTHLDQYKSDGPFEQWVRRIMINTAIKNSQRKSFQNEFAAGEELPESQELPEIIDRMSETELLQLINDLPEGYRMVFNLYAIEGFSHREISEVLKIEESTSRSQLVKARKVLQEKVIGQQKTIL